MTRSVLALGLFVALLGVAVGYVVGFRHGWALAPMAAAVPRSAVGAKLLASSNGELSGPVRAALEADVDSGLVWWASLERHPAAPLINRISGIDVMPGYERYLAEAATYRRSHPASTNGVTLEGDLAAAEAQRQRVISEVVARFAR